MINIPNLKYKTTLCHSWLEGTPCEKGQNCYFAHGQQQLRKIEENQQIISNRNMYLIHYQYSNNYKTVYCKFYAKGQCKLGASCTFAHKKKEKRKVNKKSCYQQPFASPYMQYHIPLFYPHLINIQGNQYSEQINQAYDQVQIVNQCYSQIPELLNKDEEYSKIKQIKLVESEKDNVNKKKSLNIQTQQINQIQKEKSCLKLE